MENIEIDICKSFNWNINRIITPSYIFEALFSYLNFHEENHEFNKDSLLELFTNLFNNIIFANVKNLLKYNIGVLSVSIFYYSLSIINEKIIDFDNFINFIIEFLKFPVNNLHKFEEIQQMPKSQFKKEEIEYLSTFIFFIDPCCIDLYETISEN
jgi:hypothetical protein